jgi:hypothetical protein
MIRVVIRSERDEAKCLRTTKIFVVDASKCVVDPNSQFSFRHMSARGDHKSDDSSNWLACIGKNLNARDCELLTVPIGALDVARISHIPDIQMCSGGEAKITINHNICYGDESLITYNKHSSVRVTRIKSFVFLEV